VSWDQACIPLCPHKTDLFPAITHLITESSSLFQNELKKKQESIDSLHSSLRTTSAQVGEARRTLESLQEKLKAQQLARQRVFNLKRACQEEEYQLLQLEQRHGRLDVDAANAWEMDLEMVLDGIAAAARTQQPQSGAENGYYPGPGGSAEEQAAARRLPSAAVLRARLNALRDRSGQTRRAVEALQARSKDRELKYRRLVALCTRRPETEVDTLLDTLTRAVESEKGELEITRVRRFLGGVEGVA
jgi:ribosomal protein L17